MADTPEVFDVIVMENLYGDILSDVAAQIAGSVGLAGSSNIGEHCAMFEAIHGSAPRRAGQNMANPSGLFLGAIQMLVHIGQVDVAERAHNAWLKTIEDGVHTYDIFKEGVSTQKVGTREFAEAVVARLGQRPEKLKAVSYQVPAVEVSQAEKKPLYKPTVPGVKTTMGVDVFVHKLGCTPEWLAEQVQAIETPQLKLQLISNRGQGVWPNGMPETFCTDHWRCRFLNPSGSPIQHSDIVTLLDNFQKAGLDFIKTENLCAFDGEKGWSAAQGA
jgi:isocitrate dehydrogenase